MKIMRSIILTAICLGIGFAAHCDEVLPPAQKPVVNQKGNTFILDDSVGQVMEGDGIKLRLIKKEEVPELQNLDTTKAGGRANPVDCVRGCKGKDGSFFKWNGEMHKLDQMSESDFNATRSIKTTKSDGIYSVNRKYKAAYDESGEFSFVNLNDNKDVFTIIHPEDIHVRYISDSGVVFLQSGELGTQLSAIDRNGKQIKAILNDNKKIPIFSKVIQDKLIVFNNRYSVVDNPQAEYIMNMYIFDANGNIIVEKKIDKREYPIDVIDTPDNKHFLVLSGCSFSECIIDKYDLDGNHIKTILIGNLLLEPQDYFTDGDYVYFRASNKILCINGKTMDLKWVLEGGPSSIDKNVAAPGISKRNPGVVERTHYKIFNDYIFFNQAGNTGAVNYKNGEIPWQFWNDVIKYYKIKNNAYINSTGSTIFAIDIESRKVLWETDLLDTYPTTDRIGAPSREIIHDFKVDTNSMMGYVTFKEPFYQHFQIIDLRSGAVKASKILSPHSARFKIGSVSSSEIQLFTNSNEYMLQIEK